MKQTWPAPERNKQPIADVLRRVLPARGTVLEIASGTGQHVTYFASQFEGLIWQPSDVDAQNLASIAAWVQGAGLANLRAPLTLDVCQPDWNVGALDVVYNANMIHIAPWECCVAIVAGAARHLTRDGLLIMYGPFRLGGEHTSTSNADFDASLKARDPRWGVRDYEAVAALADSAGLAALERVPMPANNQTLVFQRRS